MVCQGGVEVKEGHKTGSRLESDKQREREKERAVFDLSVASCESLMSAVSGK